MNKFDFTVYLDEDQRNIARAYGGSYLESLVEKEIVSMSSTGVGGLNVDSVIDHKEIIPVIPSSLNEMSYSRIPVALEVTIYYKWRNYLKIV